MVTLVLVLLGLALGSSVNALVFRLRIQTGKEVRSPASGVRVKKQKRLASQRYSMLKGRSICPHCEYQLEGKDLIPVVSWLWLRGKCRKCKKPISVQYPLVELGLAALFAVSYLAWPQPLEGWYAWADLVIWLAGVYGLTALFVYDLRWSLLPDRIVMPLIGLGVLDVILVLIFGGPQTISHGQTLGQGSTLLAPFQGQTLETVWYYLLGLVPVAGLYYLIYLYSRGRMVGLGDVKLGVFIGLSLGWPGALLVLVFANVLGALYVMPGMLAGKLSRRSRVPFGPFLIAAYIIAGIWGGTIVSWYLAGLGMY